MDDGAADGPGPAAPGWLADWCRTELGSGPIRLLHTVTQQSEVFGLELADGRRIAVKRRPDPAGRVPDCLRAQAVAYAAGIPCPEPLAMTQTGTHLVHAEQWRPDGMLRVGSDVAHATDSARELARLTSVLRDVAGPPGPLPDWLRTDLPDPWAATGRPPGGPPDLDTEPARTVQAITSACCQALLAAPAEQPDVAVHGDWEAQNLRWKGRRLVVVHDWDSIVRIDVAFAAGCAAAGFASSGQPDLAPLAASAAFLDSFQETSGRRFSTGELRRAWAASLVTPLHNARVEIVTGRTPLTLPKLLRQAPERLRRAGA